MIKDSPQYAMNTDIHLLNSYDSGERPVAGTCECGSKPSDSIKRQET